MQSVSDAVDDHRPKDEGALTRSQGVAEAQVVTSARLVSHTAPCGLP